MTVLLSTFLAPTLLIRLISLVFPDEPAEIAGLLEITSQTLLLLYGVLSVSVAAILAGVTHGYRRSHEQQSERPRRQTTLQFLVAGSFAVAFLGARTLVTLSGIVGTTVDGSAGAIPVRELWVWGYHVHHFYIGFALLVFVGWLAVFRETYSRRIAAVLYGLGLGIFVDEIGMLLTEGNYFMLSTYFIAVLFTSLFLAGFYWDLRTHRG
ncbi:hypothetical protein ACERIT_07290 [Halopenitus sp. H-Gu1]|uniref:hypothetical protein n=1 Tax=Halopenitus sp. H-Gu1 TaxID=3242697 RepID=UPI00359E9FD0